MEFFLVVRFPEREMTSDGLIDRIGITRISIPVSNKYIVFVRQYDLDFPIDGLGACLSMDTVGTAGQWMNTDCTAKMPVVCSRPLGLILLMYFNPIVSCRCVACAGML